MQLKEREAKLTVRITRVQEQREHLSQVRNSLVLVPILDAKITAKRDIDTVADADFKAMKKAE